MYWSPLLLASALGAQAETYDYLIAGAGTAGLVIANRLSEDPDVTVAVIEPGPDVSTDPVVQTVDWSFSPFNESINFQYASVDQPNIDNRSFVYRAGRAIGGTSSVNGMIYIRGDKAQFDAWEDLGNEGWNWDSVFAYAKQGEKFAVPTASQTVAGAGYEAGAHGESGPLAVGYPFDLSNSSFYEKASQTWEALGFEKNTDLNGGSIHGYNLAPETLDRDANVRASSAHAYYEPFKSRENLKIVRGTVKRITWSSATGDAVASGFEYVDPSGQQVLIGATREVILSASAYRNPLILEASGVGNPKILAKLGVDIKIELPGVGESMIDHNAMGLQYSTSENITGKTPFATMVTAQDVFGDQTAAFADVTQTNLSTWAHIASEASGGAISQEAFEKRFQIQHDLIFKKNVTIAQIFLTNLITSIVPQFWVTMAFSWGSVHLGSLDKIDEPIIDPKIFAIDFDATMLAAVLRLVLKVYDTMPLKSLISASVSPTDEQLPLNATDSVLGQYVKKNVFNSMHTVGTCAMVPRELGGVVNSKVKVYGTKNVRIVDASIIPSQLSGHTTAPLYAIAEKAAEIIQTDYKPIDS